MAMDGHAVLRGGMEGGVEGHGAFAGATAADAASSKNKLSPAQQDDSRKGGACRRASVAAFALLASGHLYSFPPCQKAMPEVAFPPRLGSEQSTVQTLPPTASTDHKMWYWSTSRFWGGLGDWYLGFPPLTRLMGC